LVFPDMAMDAYREAEAALRMPAANVGIY